MKKLTRREWYLAAQFWGPDGDDNQYHLASLAEIQARRESENLDAQYEHGDRVCFYAQYCLERAGIPAGDK